MERLKFADLEIIRALADCNLRVSEVARRSYQHRSNVIYHVKRIKRITGLDPLKFYDLIKLLDIVKAADALAEADAEREKLIRQMWL